MTHLDGISMAKDKRPRLSSEQKERIWNGWRSGESMSHLGRELGKDPATIFGVLKVSGGIAPRERIRSERTLSIQDRETISRGLAAGDSLHAIARSIGRSPSTISREVARNGGRKRYRALVADQAAWNNARRPKSCLLAQRSKIRELVTQKILLKWSPEQISGWLKVNYPDDKLMQISHETIYRSLYIQERGVLDSGLHKHLRRGRIFRHSKHGRRLSKSTHSIVNGISISERPPEIDGRTTIGHWEGDLISGKRNSHIVTLVEKQSRFTILVNVEGKDTKSVVDALARYAKRLPPELWKSLTWDRGSELADHRRLTLTTALQVYFCDPSSPWQRGTNENTNRLLRQYFPKGTDLSMHNQAILDEVASELNQRPRKILGFSTPAVNLWGSVASTG